MYLSVRNLINRNFDKSMNYNGLAGPAFKNKITVFFYRHNLILALIR